MEDFSFPTIDPDQDSLCQLTFPQFAASSRWFMPSEPDATTTTHHRRSFSSAEDSAKISDALRRDLEVNSPALSNDDCGERFIENEKMDMLWEDFNEEIKRISGDEKKWAEKNSNGEAGSDASAAVSCSESNSEQLVEVYCVQALGGVSRSRSMIHHRRPSLLVLLKVLKKLFLIQKTRPSTRT